MTDMTSAGGLAPAFPLPSLRLPSLPAAWAYPAQAGTRDLRFDFMRGFAMLSVICAHLEMFSWFNFVFWERLGLISGAGMFVVTAGLVLGLVNRKVMDKDGLQAASAKLWQRCLVLYKAQVAVVMVILGLSALDVLDMTAVTTFTDRWAGQTYPLMPAADLPWMQQLAQVMLLKSAPHQIQILSLYIVLIGAAPVALWLLQKRLVGVYIALSWTLYFAGYLMPKGERLFGMQFEYAFPVLFWQVYFTHALAVGFFRAEIADWLRNTTRRRLVIGVSALLAFGFFLFAQMTANPSFPAWSRLDWISGEQFQAIYGEYFSKNHPGLPRILNVATFFITFYAVLTYAWRPLQRALGWLLIPLGEASLYVFVMHLVFIAAIDQIPGYFDVIPAFDDVWGLRLWINTAFYLGTVLGLWTLVRNKVLFSVIPR